MWASLNFKLNVVVSQILYRLRCLDITITCRQTIPYHLLSQAAIEMSISASQSIKLVFNELLRI